MNLHSQLIGREFLMRHTPSHEAYTYTRTSLCSGTKSISYWPIYSSDQHDSLMLGACTRGRSYSPKAASEYISCAEIFIRTLKPGYFIILAK